MSYAKIPNLYNDQTVLLFREVFALEKIHGSSAHIAFKDSRLAFFAGGAKHAQFVALFDGEALLERFQAVGHSEIVIHGEAYGGKMHRMSKTYGPDLRFVAFDVRVGDVWLAIPQAADVVARLNLEFVHFEHGPADLTWLDQQRDSDSVQAIRNGVGPGCLREGIVIRPPIEVRLNNGARVCAKHKRKEFMETKTPREVDPAKQTILAEASAVAEEYVVPMRLEHAIDKIRAEGVDLTVKETGLVVRRVTEDVRTEEGESIAWSKEVEKAIARQAASLYKKWLKRETNEI